MTTSIYVTSTQTFSGKSALCVGLLRRFQQEGRLGRRGGSGVDTQRYGSGRQLPDSDASQGFISGGSLFMNRNREGIPLKLVAA